MHCTGTNLEREKETEKNKGKKTPFQSHKFWKQKQMLWYA